jgi:hypothetical protein
VSRRAPGRATRQILSGSQLSPSRETIGGQVGAEDSISLVLVYFVALATLVILSAIVWAIWGMGPASVILLILAIGLVAAWLVL